jgi:hypothetical protein
MKLSSPTKIKQLYMALAAILLMIILYQITREEVLLQPEHRLQEMLGERPQLLPNSDALMQNTNSALAPEKTDLNRPPVANTQTAPVAQAQIDAPDAWRVADASMPTPTLSVPDGVSVYEPVSLDMDNPKYPEAGEQLSLTMPGGERLRVNIESSTSNPNGDYSWRGHLDGYGDEYPVVMTYGGNSVFATVTTPKGSYTLESVAGSGWVYKNPSEVELSNPGSNDYLDIPNAN